MTFQYGGVGNEFTVRVSIGDLSRRDKQELLWKLLCEFDPKQEGARYEEYQRAAEVVLQVAQ